MAELTTFRGADEIAGTGEGIEVGTDQRVVVQAGEERPEYRKEDHQEQQPEAGRCHQPTEPPITAVGQRQGLCAINHARSSSWSPARRERALLQGHRHWSLPSFLARAMNSFSIWASASSADLSPATARLNSRPSTSTSCGV